MGYLRIPKGSIIKLSRIRNFLPQRVAILVAGSQAQAGSALSKIAAKTYRGLEVKPGDKVIFSADSIPGNEVAIHGLIDDLSRLGAMVSYSDILDDLHVSGHAAQSELALMINLVRPKYLVPIGGAFRQMKQYSLLAQRMGYQEKQILLPEGGDSVEILAGGQIRIGPKLSIKTHLVDSRIREEI